MTAMGRGVRRRQRRRARCSGSPMPTPPSRRWRRPSCRAARGRARLRSLPDALERRRPHPGHASTTAFLALARRGPASTTPSPCASPRLARRPGSPSARTPEVTTVRAGEPDFFRVAGMWRMVVESRGRQMVAAGHLTEAERRAALADYTRGCRRPGALTLHEACVIGRRSPPERTRRDDGSRDPRHLLEPPGRRASTSRRPRCSARRSPRSSARRATSRPACSTGAAGCSPRR